MNKCKQLDCQLHCKATSCLKDAVQADMEKEDRPIEDLLKEQTYVENTRNVGFVSFKETEDT